MKYIFKLIVLIFLFSCGANFALKSRYSTIEKKLDQQKYTEALNHLKKKGNEYNSNDRVLQLLDLAILEHYNGDYKNSIAHFEEAEQTIDKLYTKSISKAALSIITNDKAMDYDGEDYENVYLNIFKALNYIELNQNEDAFVEIRRINEKLSELETRFTEEISALQKEHTKKDKSIDFGEFNFSDTAIGRFLSMILYRSDESYDDARIDKEKLNQLWNTNSHIYNSKKPNLNQFKTTLLNDSSIVNIVSFIGHGPKKYAWEIDVNTFKDHTVLRATHPKYHEILPLKLDKDLSFKVSLPKIKARDSRIESINVSIDGVFKEKLVLLENMSNVAVNTYKMYEKNTLVKSLIRSSLKAIASAKASKEIRKETGGGLWGDVLSFAAKATIQSTESADLRSWRLLPGACYVGEYVLPFGQHQIKIDYIGTNGQLIKSTSISLNLTQSKTLNVVNSYAF